MIRYPLLADHLLELESRIEHLQSALVADSSIDALFISTPLLLRYYTGYPISSGAIYIRKGSLPELFVDARYYDIISDVPLWKAILVEGSLEASLQNRLVKNEPERPECIAFQGDAVSYAVAEKLRAIAPKLLSWVSMPDLFSQLRRKKSLPEQKAIQASCALCEEGFYSIIPKIQEGVSERDLRKELLLFWIEKGADMAAFEPIIAFGSNSAIPHWRASDTLLKRGDIILIDIGVSMSGYSSDMTRTFSFGAPLEPDFDLWFSAAHTALLSAEKSARPGIFGKEVDAAARKELALLGFENAFTHGLGHGVGLDVHEAPRLSPKASLDEPALAKGDVITLEPGLYFPGKGGVRLENSYLVEETGLRSFMPSPFFSRLDCYLEEIALKKSQQSKI